MKKYAPALFALFALSASAAGAIGEGFRRGNFVEGRFAGLGEELAIVTRTSHECIRADPSIPDKKLRKLKVGLPYKFYLANDEDGKPLVVDFRKTKGKRAFLENPCIPPREVTPDEALETLEGAGLVLGDVVKDERIIGGRWRGWALPRLQRALACVRSPSSARSDGKSKPLTAEDLRQQIAQLCGGFNTLRDSFCDSKGAGCDHHNTTSLLARCNALGHGGSS